MTDIAASAPPEFRRPKREDALEVAMWIFRQGERVDLQSLAERLQIGRSTLYRWVGDREQLIDAVMMRLVAEIWLETRPHAQGEGVERMLDEVRRFITATTNHPALRQFATREPSLALRILMNPGGRVPTALREGLKRQLADAVPGAHVDDEVFGLLALTGTALVWANVAAGHDPQIETAVAVMRTVLTAHIRTDGRA